MPAGIDDEILLPSAMFPCVNMISVWYIVVCFPDNRSFTLHAHATMDRYDIYGINTRC